jgi:hypothetical protein
LLSAAAESSLHYNGRYLYQHCVFLLLMRTKLMVSLYFSGVRGGWHNLQAVIPGGSSVPVLDEADCQNVRRLLVVLHCAALCACVQYVCDAREGCSC